MKKIVYFTPRPFSLIFGGTEVQATKTKAHVQANGYKVEFADYTSMYQFNDVSLVHFFTSDYIFWDIAQILLKKRIPYVVSSIYYPIGVTAQLTRLARRIPRTSFWMKRRLLENAAAILPNSNSEAKRLTTTLGIRRNRMYIIPNGVDSSIVGSNPAAFRKSCLPTPIQNHDFILSVGRLEERKNTLALTRAALELKIPLVLIGNLTCGDPYSSKLSSIIDARNDLICHIPALPPESETLANGYAAAKVHALVSWFETPGLSSLEAAANGANLVVGRCAPVEEYFAGHSYIANPGSDADIRLQVQRAMSAPRDHFGQSEWTLKTFSWAEVGVCTSRVYNRVLEEID